jgi:hypothetical protein
MVFEFPSPLFSLLIVFTESSLLKVARPIIRSGKKKTLMSLTVINPTVIMRVPPRVSWGDPFNKNARLFVFDF